VKCDELFSSFAFKFSLRRYIKEGMAAVGQGFNALLEDKPRGRAFHQGLTLVHIRAQLEHIRETFVGQVGSCGTQRQLTLS